MDPFVGLGSSAIAAYRLAAPFIGFDIDGTYLAEAKRRLERLQNSRMKNRTQPKALSNMSLARDRRRLPDLVSA